MDDPLVVLIKHRRELCLHQILFRFFSEAINFRALQQGFEMPAKMRETPILGARPQKFQF